MNSKVCKDAMFREMFAAADRMKAPSLKSYLALMDAQVGEVTQAADEANARNERVEEVLSRPLSFGRVCEG